MTTTTEICMPVWKTPDSYFGYNPVGDFVLYSRHRDSELMVESNWDCLQESLNKIIKTLPEPNIRTQKDYYGEDEELPSGWMYSWEASHWAVGWVQYLMIRHDAPEVLIEAADEMYNALRDYPILDEEDYSERQDNAIYKYWQDCSIKERIEYCKESGDSIFAARRDNHIPEDVYSSLYEGGSFY